MRPLILVSLLAFAAALTATVAWELGMFAGPQAAILAPPRPAAAGPLATPAADRVGAWVVTALARPLFSPTRRPSAIGSAMSGDGVPRLTGIVVGPFARKAMFAPAHGKSVVLGEGDRIESYTVTSIEPGQVRLSGVDGERVLHTSFPPGPRAASDAPVPAPRRNGGAPSQ